MSKSVGNTILLSDPPEAIAQKMRGAVTDVQKVRKNDPGRPEVCLVFTYHQKFNPGETAEIEAGCRSGALGMRGLQETCVREDHGCADAVPREAGVLRCAPRRGGRYPEGWRIARPGPGRGDDGAKCAPQ